MTDYSSDNAVYELWVLLRRASLVILKVRNKELRQFGISSSEAAVLVAVNDLDNAATPSNISKHLLREAHSVSSLITRMETEGLLNKSPFLVAQPPTTVRNIME